MRRRHATAGRAARAVREGREGASPGKEHEPRFMCTGLRRVGRPGPSLPACLPARPTCLSSRLTLYSSGVRSTAGRTTIKINLVSGRPLGPSERGISARRSPLEAGAGELKVAAPRAAGWVLPAARGARYTHALAQKWEGAMRPRRGMAGRGAVMNKTHYIL